MMKDQNLKEVFNIIDATEFKLPTVIKDLYNSSVGAIIGQKYHMLVISW